MKAIFCGATIVAVLAFPLPHLASAEPAPVAPAAPLPAPKWVQMFDQGEADPRLKGIQTPRGIKMEALPFKAVADSMQRGNVEQDGWRYLASGGHVVRRRPHDPELMKQLQAAAEAKKGPPTKASADAQWIEQILLSGLAKQADADTGITLGPDGWLYVSGGSGDHRTESWDDSQAAVLRSGAIFRLNADGSRLEEFARGFVRPSAVAFDALGNAFCVDSGASATKFVTRLIHVLPGGDYGWRQAKLAKGAEAKEPLPIEPDPIRAAANGERPGTLPAMLSMDAKPGSSAIVYRGAAFPDFFQNLLLTTDSKQRIVRAFAIERDGATFRVAGQFDLLQSDDPQFSPNHISQKPGGAIEVTDEKSRRTYRLSWGGIETSPAIALSLADRLAKITTADGDQLWQLVESPDYEVRSSAAAQIVASANRDAAVTGNSRERLAVLLIDERLPVAVRATVIYIANHLSDKKVRAALCRLLEHENSEIVRLAADVIGQSPPREQEELTEVADAVKGMYGRVTDAGSERALQMALARLAVAGVADAAEWGFEATSVTHGPKMSRYVFDGHVRALEMVPGAAKELMLGNLDVAINLDVGEPQERQRIKEFVTLTAEAMRTRELADFLDALLRGEDDLFVKVEAPLEARLIAGYQNVEADPPSNADAVIEWLDKHPGGPVEVDIAAFETLSKVGTTKTEAFNKLADRLLTQPAATVALARRLLTGHLDRSLLPRIRDALKHRAAKDDSGEVAGLLIELAKLDKAAN